MAVVDVEREAPSTEPEPEVSRETYAALLHNGETPEEALQRLERSPKYQKIISSDEGQALLAAATAQVLATPNGGVKKKSRAAATAEVMAATEPTAAELEDLGIPVALQIAVAAGEAEEDEGDADPADPDNTAGDEPLVEPGYPERDPIDVAEANGAAVEAFQDTVAKVAGGKRVEAPTAMAIAITSIEVASNVREDLGDLDELTASIREHGILQPIVVTGVYGDDSKPKGFRVLEGHRRLAAAAAAGYETVPAIFDHRLHLGEPGAGRATVQLVENLQRADLNELEIAHAIAAVLEADPKLTHAAVGRWIGKDRSWVTNVLRLLETAPEVQAAVLEGKISATHARAIAGVDVDLQSTLLEAVTEGGLSAKATEVQARRVKGDAERIRERDAGIATRLAEAIAMLEKVASRDKSTIAVEDFYTGTEIKKGLTADGWHVTNGGGVQVIKESGECGCAGVWRLAIPYNDQGHVALHPACNSAEHATARREAVDAKWRRDQALANEVRRKEREAAEEASRAAAGAVVELLAERPPSELARRLVVWGLLVADEDPDPDLVQKYVKRDADDDPAWTITTAIPVDELEDVQGRLVARLLGSYQAGPDVKAAVDEWSKVAHPESLELAEAAPATKGKKLGKEVRLGDLVLIGPDEYLVVSITYPGQEPGADERPPAIVQLGIKGPVKAVDYRLHHVPLADLTADQKAKAWRAPQGALQVVKPSQRVTAPPDDAGAIAAAREPGGVLECVGSNHVPGCAHMGGAIPAAKPAPAGS